MNIYRTAHASRTFALTALLASTFVFAGCDAADDFESDDDFRAAAAIPTSEADLEGWHAWIFAQPVGTGPLADMTGDACADGQSGNTWYLAGTLGGPAERECTIPPGKQLVFPIVNLFGAMPDSYFDTPESREAQIASYVSTGDWVIDSTCELSVILDGVEVYDDPSETWVSVYEPFEVDLVDDPDNIAAWYGIQGGTVPTLGAGYYAHLPPLTPGEHTLEFGGVLCSGEQVFFSTSLSYVLHIEP